jgi:asparagine synthetase B (glutamine-hydrolysing)
MCGILAVKSRIPLALSQHQPALDILKRRGPDLAIQKQVGNVFIAQTVLHITGTAEFYNREIADGFAYNGEIYDHRWFGSTNNDVELAYSTARERPDKFRYFEGPWAWAYTTDDKLLYASDPQGERCLYHYQDDNILIVCSEVAPILTYIQPEHQEVPYLNKSWSMIEQTPWQGVSRCRPGMLYRDGKENSKIDSIWDWIKPQAISHEEVQYKFQNLVDRWHRTINPTEPATLSYSGGIDSNIIMNNLRGMELLSINTVGKDYIVTQAQKFLNPTELANFKQIDIDEQQWADAYRDLVNTTKMPAQSWSHVGRWLIAKHASNRIIFTGLGADELFGGYDCYRQIEYTVNGSTSPYSNNDHDNVWSRCLDVYNGDPKQATLLMDYWYQVVGVDAPGADRLGAAWGKETRNPFMLKSIIEFALNLPWESKVSQHGKIPLRQEFLRRWSEDLIFTKQGFAGHANDSLPWLGVDITSSGNRHQDWQSIAQKTFYTYTRP